MTANTVEQIFRDTAYIRIGGTDAEKQCAAYFIDYLAGLGLHASCDPFDVQMGDIDKAILTVTDDTGTHEIPCKGYMCAGSDELEAPLYYLTATDDKMSLEGVRGKIVLFDGYLGYWLYQNLCEHGAVGFISYDGNVHFADRDIDRRELRGWVADANGEKKGRKKLPGVNINAKDAVALIENNAKTVKITLCQHEYTGQSQNVVLELPGDTMPEKTVVFTAHYDSTPLSQGAYDNMSGSVCLLAMAEYFAQHAHARTLRFIWCGSEERGLLGSKAYCREHSAELENIEFCINIDMIGCTMGRFIACCTSEDALVHYVSYLGRERGFQAAPYQGIYSSDSTPFADKGIPAISFCRSSPRECAMIHNAYDTLAYIKTAQMQADIEFITAFSERMVNAVYMPVEHTVPDNLKEEIEKYLCRKK